MGCYVIAEIGVNAGKDLDVAKRLIDAAIEAGADACKFQLWQPETFPDLEPYRLSIYELHQLQHYAMRNGIDWFCTPFDKQSVYDLEELGMTTWKIPSNRAVWDNQPMLEAIKNVKQRKLTLISCGCASDIEIEKVYMSMQTSRYPILMRCISKYPTQEREIQVTRNAGDYIYTGLSDHSICIYAPAVAVALGAQVVEKHLTLSRNQAGPDHASSLEPDEFKLMVKMIRKVEARG